MSPRDLFTMAFLKLSVMMGYFLSCKVSVRTCARCAILQHTSWALKSDLLCAWKVGEVLGADRSSAALEVE